MGVIWAMVAVPALAVDYNWNVGNGDWGEATNWDPNGVPGYPTNGGDWAIINNGVGTGPTVSASMNNCYGLLLGNTTMTIQNGAYVGSKATGRIGTGVGTTGVLNVEAGGTVTFNYNKYVGLKHAYVGFEGNGTLNIAGTFHTNRYTYIGFANTSTGVINAHEGTEFNSNNGGNLSFFVGYDGNGTLNVDGGVFNIAGRLTLTHAWDDGTGTWVWDPNSQGHIEISGGTINADHIYFDINSRSLAAGSPEVKGTIHQTGGEFIFFGADQALALTRVNQAIDQGWWTKGADQEWYIWQDAAGTHVKVPEPATMILLGLGGLLLRRRR